MCLEQYIIGHTIEHACVLTHCSLCMLLNNKGITSSYIAEIVDYGV